MWCLTGNPMACSSNPWWLRDIFPFTYLICLFSFLGSVAVTPVAVRFKSLQFIGPHFVTYSVVLKKDDTLFTRVILSKFTDRVIWPKCFIVPATILHYHNYA